MSNKVELKLSGNVSEYEFIWNEEIVGTIVAGNKGAPALIDDLINMTLHLSKSEFLDMLSQPEFLRALADTLESLNKKV